MDSLLIIGGIIFFSFWYLDHSLKKWKSEQDIKLDEIKNTVERIETYFEEN